MKKIFQHPPEPVTGKKYWRSLDQLANTPQFRQWLTREFPKGADEFNAGGVSRRSFLKLMGASTALAGLGLSSCRRPEKHLVPFTKSAEWSIPGKPLFYASSMPHRNGAQPLIVTTHDGRPTKIEGNPHHPTSMGATGTFAQATLLDMYDPDRSATFRNRGQPMRKAADFDKWLVTRFDGKEQPAVVSWRPGRSAAKAWHSSSSRTIPPRASALRAEIAQKISQGNLGGVRTPGRRCGRAGAQGCLWRGAETHPAA